MAKPNNKKQTQRPNSETGGPRKPKSVVVSTPPPPKKKDVVSSAVDYLNTLPKDKYGIDAAFIKGLKKVLGK